MLLLVLITDASTFCVVDIWGDESASVVIVVSGLPILSVTVLSEHGGELSIVPDTKQSNFATRMSSEY